MGYFKDVTNLLSAPMQMGGPMNDTRKIGIFLALLGSLFLFLGVVLFFRPGLLTIGNILFLTGLTLTIGPWNTLKFFKRWKCIHGTICFALGILLVLWGWPVIGMLIDLFGNFFHVFLIALQRLPYIGGFFRMPCLQRIASKFKKGALFPVHRT